MADNLKVTFTSIKVNNNGEWTGKGEIYYSILIDEEPVFSVSPADAAKVADGETIILQKVYPVAKKEDQSLTIECSVSEKDNLDRDETTRFLDEYTYGGGWGIGVHRRVLRDRNLDVTVTYKIERE